MPSAAISANLNPRILPWNLKSTAVMSSSSSSFASVRCASSLSQAPLRYSVLGAGFAGFSVAWHLLQHSPKELPMCIDIYDEVGIGGGASGVAGGLLLENFPQIHVPYGTRNLQLGSTWEWNSRNYSSHVPSEEASKALQELLRKAAAIYPAIKNWAFTGASARLRAMPLTPDGSLPLLG